MENKNSNKRKSNLKWYTKINLKWLSISVLFSIFFGFLTTYFFNNNSQQFFEQLVNNSLAFSALPSLLISTLVIKSLSEVRNQIKLEEKNREFFDRRNTQEFSYFKSDYENNFKIDCDELQKDLEKIVTEIAGSAEDFKSRVRVSSYKCFKSLELYKYVSTRIKLRELDLDNVESYSDEYEFTNEDFEFLKVNLNELNSDVENKISDIHFCKELDISLGKFRLFAEFLLNESDSTGGETLIDVNEQDSTAENDGGFYD